MILFCIRNGLIKTIEEKYKKKTCIYFRKKFKSIDFIINENDRKFTYYPEFINKNKDITFLKSEFFSFFSQNSKKVCYFLKLFLFLYIFGIFLLFPAKFFSNFIIINKRINEPFFFLFSIICLEQFLSKKIISSHFNKTFFINLFLFILSIFSDFFLKLTKNMKNTFIITTLIKGYIIINIWFSKFFKLEINNSFYKNSDIYRKFRSIITVFFFLDLVFNLTIVFSNFSPLNFDLNLFQLIKCITIFIPLNNYSILIETLNSSPGLLFLCRTMCISFLLYYVAFDKKMDGKNLYLNEKKNVKIFDKKANVLISKKNNYNVVSNFSLLKKDSLSTLHIDDLILGEEKNNLSEISKWTINKSGINVPYGIILYSNEYQTTKQKLWYEIKNKKKIK